jgi:2'-5' RNA ligase
MIFAVATLIDKVVWKKILDSIPKSRIALVYHDNLEFAHISWIVSQQMDVVKVERTLQSISSFQSPIMASSGGLGIFCNENPVITLQLVRNPSLNHLHTKVWTKCHRDMENSKPYYSPDFWMPHVTLLHDEFTQMEYSEFLSNCIFSPIQMDIPLTNLAIMYQDGQNTGVLSYSNFTGKG